MTGIDRLRHAMSRSADLSDEQVIDEVLGAWWHWMNEAEQLRKAIARHQQRTTGQGSKHDRELWAAIKRG